MVDKPVTAESLAEWLQELIFDAIQEHEFEAGSTVGRDLLGRVFLALPSGDVYLFGVGRR